MNKFKIYLAILLFLFVGFGGFSQTRTKLYTQSFVAKNEIKDSAQMNAENCKVGIEYFDNLGRPEQSIGYRIAVGGGNIVGYYEYDGLGRQSKNYLPYNASGENQDFRTNAKTEQLNYYNNNKPYTEVNFDNSPYNRVNSATGVGTDMTGHNKTVAFTVNTSNFNYWSFVGKNNVQRQTYGVGLVAVSTVTDGDGMISKSFTNSIGQVFMKLKGNQTTNYVYDDIGNLRYIIQGSPTGTQITVDYLNKFSYYYEYNEKGLMTLKKLPGTNPVTMQYYANDLLGTVCDGNNNFTHIEYDVLNRPKQTSLYVKTATPIDGQTQSMVTNMVFPDAEKYPISFTHYDDYEAADMGLPANFPVSYTNVEGFNNVQARSVRGVQTIQKTRTELNNTWLYSVVFYDNRGRVIQTYSTNHLGGFDRITNQYDFEGKLITTLHEHSPNNVVVTRLQTVYEYDPNGRLLTTSEKINDNQMQVVSKLEYNSLGQVVAKKLHKKTDNTFVQTVDYKYNIRGQLTDINDINNAGNDYFREQISYDGLYNGSIRSVSWASVKSPLVKKFFYTYDANNQLKKSNYNAKDGFANYSMNMTYDNIGNIKTLNRRGRVQNGKTFGFADIDNLTYVYDGNRLKKVDDTQGTYNQKYGFVDNGIDVATEYTYDANGNMTADLNRNKIYLRWSVETENGGLQQRQSAGNNRLCRQVCV